MKPAHILTAVDAHTAGQPTRVIVAGIPKLVGNTMMEIRNYFIEHYDFLRTAVTYEPRGHGNMFSAVITPSTVSDAEFGEFFMRPGGYPTMCGHGTMGVVTVMIETGAIAYSGSSRKMLIDTPAGVVEAMAEINDTKVESVTIKNVPCFLLMADVSINVKGFGKIQVDISFSGNSFYAQVDSDKLKVALNPENVDQVIKLGLMIRNTINETIPIVHPMYPEMKGISAVDFFGESSRPDARCKNLHVYGTGQIDRSPGGTAACAKMASLFTRGKLDLNEDYVQEGITGEVFRGKILSLTQIGEITAIVPQVKGKAFITALNQLIIDREDPLKYGFQL